MQRLYRLLARGVKYSIIGVSTYTLDISIVLLLTTHTTLYYPFAVAIGFFIGVTVNFLISYHWVYADSAQTAGRGYLYFVTIALLGIVVITASTTALVETLGLSLLVARTVVATLVGIGVFLINTIFNFKVL